jgi:[ribosomal protein S5]-alanine N-acetyltransferase
MTLAGRKERFLQTGKRVFLRYPHASDETEFLELMKRSRLLHRGFVSPPLEPSQFRTFLERGRQAASRSYLACRCEDQGIVGVFNLSQIFMGGFRSAYLGYYVGSPFANQGYMREGLQLVLSEAFRRLKLHRVEANIQPSNASSIALVSRAGFSREGYSRHYLKIGGRWRDHERWAILVEDWRSGKKAKHSSKDSS